MHRKCIVVTDVDLSHAECNLQEDLHSVQFWL